MDLSKKTIEQLMVIIPKHAEAGITDAPLLLAAKAELAKRPVSAPRRKAGKAKDQRSTAQEQELREMADVLGWPATAEERAARGISGVELRYGECHYAWVVLETFFRTNKRRPSAADREALAIRHGLNAGNISTEYHLWADRRRPK